MYVLGVHIIGHDTCASLVHNGEVIFVAEEERYNRDKHTRKFPINSINKCLEFANLEINDVDCIALSTDTDELIKRFCLEYSYKNYPKNKSLVLDNIEFIKKHHNYLEDLRTKLNYKKEIFVCKHHISHFASTFFMSPFLDAAILSIDGVGEFETSVLGHGKMDELKVFEEDVINFPNSLGLFYSAVTDYLGFLHHCDEGKVMGLASYGNSEVYKEAFNQIIKLRENGRYEIDLDYITYHYERDTWVSEKFVEIFGKRRLKNEVILQHHMDIAAALQKITENVLVHMATYLYEKTKSKNLCLTGGVALNCVANSVVFENTKFENIFIHPATGDAGTSIGAALFYYYKNNNKKTFLDTPYLGSGCNDEDIKLFLENNNIEYEENDTLYSDVAKILDDQKIVAWFNGRAEVGPRSLGNRSILSSPYPAEMKDIMNDKVKHRESFRPFAPSILEEKAHLYFDNIIKAPYMLMSFTVKEKMKNKIPAVTHIDNTARVQTVSKETNPEFYKLIEEFEKISSIPVLLNTSFNVMGEPVVNTLEDAYNCFMSTNIDYLVFNAKFLIQKKIL